MTLKSPVVIYEDETGEDCAFNCACGNIISPADFSSAKNIVVERKLETVTVKCLKCSAEIQVQLKEPSFIERVFEIMSRSSKPIRNGSSL